MSTEKQREANRRNAQRSTGPKTAAGKASVRFNALDWRIYAVEQIIPGEDPEAFKAYAEAIAESSHPADQREQDLVDQIVAHGWRLKRLFKVEPQAWNRLFTILENTPGVSEDTRLAGAIDHNPQFFPRLQRLIASVQRSYHQAAADLDRLQAARAKSAQSQAESEEEKVPRIPLLVWDNGFDPPIYPCGNPFSPESPSESLVSPVPLDQS